PSPLRARHARRGAAEVTVGGRVGVQVAQLRDGERHAGVLGAGVALRGSPVAGPQLEAPAGYLRQCAGAVEMTAVRVHWSTPRPFDRVAEERRYARAGQRPRTVLGRHWVRLMSTPPLSP